MTDFRPIFQAWRELLPADICVAAGPLLDAAPLTLCECVSVDIVDDDRMREFKNGRLSICKECRGDARRLRCRAPDRGPLWPAGLVGGLTHVRVPAPGHVAVAVARTNTIRAIRIDIEREGNLHLHTWEHVLTARELERILALPLYMRAAEAQIVWCAKEAVAKVAGRRIEPTEVEIRLPAATRQSGRPRLGIQHVLPKSGAGEERARRDSSSPLWFCRKSPSILRT